MDDLTFDMLYAAGWSGNGDFSATDVGSDSWLQDLKANNDGATAPLESGYDYSPTGETDTEFGALNTAAGNGLLTQDNQALDQLLARQNIQTGADVAAATPPATPQGRPPPKETGLMDVLNSKMGAGIASQLVMGMLGGVGAGAAAQKNTEANRQLQNELMDKKYQQQLDYIRQMRQAGTVKRQDWKPVVATGLLGAK
jgi:hypothetical protein